LSLKPEIDKRLLAWAEPILEHLGERERRGRALNIAIALIFSSIVIVSLIVVYLHLIEGPKILPYVFAGIMITMFAYLGGDSILARLSPVDVTAPQVYSLHILRILNRSNDPGPKFEDAVARFVRIIEVDLDDLQNNLAASRTVKVIKGLRVLVRRYATAVKEKREGSTKSMRETFETAASMFYRFEDVESLGVFLETELLNTAAIAERTSITNPMRPYVSFLRKWPVTMILLLAVFSPVAYALYLYNPFLDVLPGFGLAIVLAYRGDIGRWVRDKLGE
jgi:hypothetical protein